MLAARRHAVIMELARVHGSVKVTELVDVLGVSDVTVRRDLEQLARAGNLEKVHGGAVLSPGAHRDATDQVTVSESTDAEGPVLGALIPKSSYYFNRVVNGVRRALSQRNGRLMVAVSDYQPGQDLHLANGLIESGAEALLLAPADEVDWAGVLGVPTVLVERRARDRLTGPTGLSWVRTDHERGAALAVRHLHELGHHTIAVFGRGDTPTSRAVLVGWDRALSELSLAPGPRIVGTEFPGWPAWNDELIDTLADRLRSTGATSMLMHSDEDALAVLQNGFTSRFAVPRDFSIVAYDDEFSALTRPALTAVSPPKESIGDLAVRTLLDLLSDPDSPARHIDVEPRLIVRESTGTA